MGIFPDFNGLGGIGDLRAVVGALLTFVLIIAVCSNIAVIGRNVAKQGNTPDCLLQEPCSTAAMASVIHNAFFSDFLHYLAGRRKL